MEEKNVADFDIISSEKDEFGLRELIEKYLYYWKWFVFGVIITLTGSFLYLRYTTPKYKVVATLLINDKQNENVSSETSTFKDLGLVDNNSSIFDTEIGILKSRSLIEKVVAKLGLNQMYYTQGRVHDRELYGASLPFKLNFFTKDSLFHQRDTVISIIPTSQTKFDLLDGQDKLTGSHLFGENVVSNMTNFTITPTTSVPIQVGLKISFIIQPLASTTDFYRKNILIAPVDRKSTLINISLENPKREKALDILRVLIAEYNSAAISDKTLIAENTETFINDRIDGIFKELTLLDSNTQNFKTRNNLTDITSESSLILDSNSKLEKETLDMTTQLKLVEYMAEFIDNNETQLIPTNLGLSNISLNQNTVSYNDVVLERNRLLRSSNSLNPVIVNLESQLLSLKTSISQSLTNLKSSLIISLNDLKRQEDKLNSKITSIPRQERALKDIDRQKQIVETLYLYLLEKREENAIALAIKAPNARIIDVPYGSNIPVSPRRMLVYLIGLVLGVVIPFALIYLSFLLDNKVQNIEDIESVVSAPILGDIPNSKNFDRLFHQEDDRSPLSEALRIFRTNLNFVLSKNKKGAKNIFVSSTIQGEGKSGMSINLAKILALSSKKVLLIEGDIRKPTLGEVLKVKNNQGFTHYLSDDTLKPATLIEPILLNLDFLQCGAVPPNPSELIMNGRFDELLEYTNKNYDYVIIDTAPVSMVADTILLSHNRTDLFIYVVRANYLDKGMLKIPKKLHETNRIDNMAIVLNSSNPKIAYGYGYDNALAKKPWWKRLFTSNVLKSGNRLLLKFKLLTSHVLKYGYRLLLEFKLLASHVLKYVYRLLLKFKLLTSHVLKYVYRLLLKFKLLISNVLKYGYRLLLKFKRHIGTRK